MVFETVEISTPVAESPAISWAAIAAGAVAAAALTLVLLAFGVGILTLFADGRPAKRCEVMTFSHIDAQHPVCPPIAASRCTRTDFDSCQPGTITNAR